MLWFLHRIKKVRWLPYLASFSSKFCCSLRAVNDRIFTKRQNVAGLFMEDFEQTALVTVDREPKLWLRYVDDTFIIWPHGRTQLVAFLNHLNNLCEKIQFTMEVEEENQLPFLDVLVRRNGDSLSTSVYRKKTHTDRYVHFRSHHHPQVKNKCGIMPQVKGRTALHRRWSRRGTEPPVQSIPGKWLPTRRHGWGTQQKAQTSFHADRR